MQNNEYRVLSARLDEIVTAMQDPGIDVDSALAYHKEGMELVKKIEVYLKSAEVRINKLTVNIGE